MIIPPFFVNAFTDLCMFLRPFPENISPTCVKLQEKYFDCVEAYGFEKAKKKCEAHFYDMHECVFGVIQTKRAEAIRKQRMKLYREGKLEKPFDEYPPLDAYFYIY